MRIRLGNDCNGLVTGHSPGNLAERPLSDCPTGRNQDTADKNGRTWADALAIRQRTWELADCEYAPLANQHEYAINTGRVEPGFRYHDHLPGDEVEWFGNDVGRIVAIRPLPLSRYCASMRSRHL